MAVIRGYGHVEFTLSALDGAEKEPLRRHVATILLISARGDANDLLMNSGDLRDGRMMLLLLVEEYSGKHDDGAVAMAAQDEIALNMFTGLGPFRAE